MSFHDFHGKEFLTFFVLDEIYFTKIAIADLLYDLIFIIHSIFSNFIIIKISKNDNR